MSGKAFPGGTVNAKSVGAPRVKGTYKSTIVVEGPMSVVISNLSANGGVGEVRLKNGNRTIFDTGTIALKPRKEVP